MKSRTPIHAFLKAAFFIILLVATGLGASRLRAPKQGQEATAKLVAAMVTRYHISREEIDDQISAKFLDRFLKDLDSQKLYFTSADVAELQKQRTHLDEFIKEGNIDFAFSTYNLYMKRLEERIALVHKLIDAEHDFTVKEEIVADAKDLTWGTKEEIAERWRKRIKYDLLMMKLGDDPEKVTNLLDPDMLKKQIVEPTEVNNSDTSGKAADEDDQTKKMNEAKDRLHKRYRNIARNWGNMDEDEVLEIYLTALTSSFDPHSSYMSPSTLEEFYIGMRLRLQGIGAALRSTDGYTIVAEIVPGGAAAADGRLKPGDRIMGVGQETEGELVDVVEMKLSKVVKLIRGPRGTVVRLQVRPAEGKETKIYALTRQIIELKSSEVKGEIIDAGTRVSNGRRRIGVIHIPSFYRDFDGAQDGVLNFPSTTRDVKKALRKFFDQGGVDAIIVDLRSNGGGALVEATDVSGLFIDQGPIVQVKTSAGRVTQHDDLDRGSAYSGPLVVLTNRLSASASEIFAGVIKDYKRGLLVGDSTTHGKGTVQNIMPVPQKTELFQVKPSKSGGALKLTIQQFYRVNGDSTQNRGVTSDIVLPSLIDHMDFGESFLDNALAFDHVEPAEFEVLSSVTPEVISAVRKLSGKRITASKEFQKIRKGIEKYLQHKNRKTITLNELELRQEREADTQGEKQKQDKKHVNNQQKKLVAPIFPDNAYNNEVLAITVDYVNILQQRKTAKR